MWLSQIVQKKRHWQQLLSVVVLLLVNISFYSIGQLQLQHRQQQWQQWLVLQPLQQQSWLISEQNQLKLLSSPPSAAADFVALDGSNPVLHLAPELVKSWSVPDYLLLNLPFVIWLLWLLWIRPYQQQFRQELQQLEQQTRLLLNHLDLPFHTGTNPATQLQRVLLKLQNWQKRDSEIRQLVRVQGLVDHELAIGNRVFFESRLNHYLTESGEAGSGAVFLVQLSHPEPNLSTLSKLQRLKGCVELIAELTSGWPEAVMARLADNDLSLLIPGLTGREAEQLGDRMAQVLSQASFFDQCQDFDLIHIGFVLYQQGQSSYQLMAEADMALKTAQLQGPNAAYGFNDPQKPKIKGSVWWRTELHNALKENRFLLSFQPVFSWLDNDVLQHEVLVRLASSDGDKLAAALFLPMAANCGLVSAIDQYVLLKVAKLGETEVLEHCRCSVNLNTQSLLDEAWWHWLQQQVNSGTIVAPDLALEFHEHHLIKHYKNLKPKLLQLQQWGFELIVDHVGLSLDATPYTDELPIRMLKIHPAVVRGIDHQLEQQLFIRGLLASCAGKDIKVIATGVEQDPEWQCLKKLGVVGAQGYYFSQPLARLIAQNQLSD
ncbi:MAG: EAL domain-containing protein [Gammaproteobacteria bacterium]|nr:EAL domain-containing protein [Gammaproteobacteria bacterium]MBU2056824.1 EAL domain-containing protein [Gammaproteobacteria bacterium]MBU2174644.1 EAL domain-containing protein [Gammaproteobacteria bacterium]MBU2248337.1 EAL domain-containing protein [Gammaproteobacteria bacterium]MBU2346206.1 EAL domain-containing protein [Gammaproteobacteria bacterium]